MPKIDWEGGEEQAAMSCNEEGIYYVEVARCDEKRGKGSGELMFELELKAIDFGGARLCWDNVMLGGKGLGMGIAKLSAFGFSKEDTSIESHQVVGRRAYAAVSFDEWGGKKRLSVDISEGTNCGYWKEADKPEGVRKPPPPANMGHDPFGDAGHGGVSPATTEFIEADDTPF